MSISPDVVAVLPLGSFLEYLAIRVDWKKAEQSSAKFDGRLVGGKQDSPLLCRLKCGAT